VTHVVLDTSAIVAFLRGEPEADAIEAVLHQAEELTMSAFTLFETRTVLLLRFGSQAASDFELLALKLGVRVVPFDSEQCDLASAAYRRFGEGTGHPAQLNLGDCAAYALALQLGEPLLYKGGDFVHTDIEPALRWP